MVLILLPRFRFQPLARQKVNVLMLERVSNLLLAGEPRPVQRSGGHRVWQVPVDLAFPSHGRVGCVGKLDVDARYGELKRVDTWNVLFKPDAHAAPDHQTLHLPRPALARPRC